MKGVKKVTQLDDQRLHWEAEIGGKDKEWNAELLIRFPISSSHGKARERNICPVL
jgi:uncharacterized membrane protein